MYNDTSQNYKDKVLNDSIQHGLNIYIDGNKADPNHIIDFDSTLELFNNNEFCLGCTPEIDIEFEIDKRDLPEDYNEVYVETGVDEEIVPIGYFTIQKPIQDDEFKVKIKATDYMKKFEDNKYDGSDLTFPATMLQVLQDICTKIGVELGSTSFLNSDKQIAVYDNTVSARTYLSYIAEQAGGFAVIGRDGKLYIKTFGQDTVNVDINLFKDYKWGDKFKVSKVSYEDGVQDYKFGDNTADTIYINQNNMYIVDSKQIENIYNQIKDFEVYSFEGETIIDPAYDIGDVLIIDGKKVIYQGGLEYAGKFKANIKSKIQAKTEQESMQTKPSASEKIKRVESEISQIDGKITQLAEQTDENSTTIAEHQVAIGKISDTVKSIESLTKEISGKNKVFLENCLQGNIIKLVIKGNDIQKPKGVFAQLLPSDDLLPDDNLLPYGNDNQISVTDENGNSIVYNLGIEYSLKSVGNVYDEYILEDNKSKIIRRINEDWTVKSNPTEENLGDITIPLEEGNNTIQIIDDIADIEVTYVRKNNVTNIFATKVEMESKIEQSAEAVEIDVNKKLENYSTTTEMNSAIEVTAEEINTEVSKKVDESELGTKISQNSEAVKVAWNNINEYIKLENISSLASLSIYDDQGRLMALNKNGQNFYKSGNKFGSMGIVKAKDSDTNNYGLAFVLDGKVSGNNIIPDNNFMGFCYKSKDSNGNEIIIPFFYLGKIKSSENAGIYMISDIYFEGNSIIADEFYIKNSSGQNIFIIYDNNIIYKNNLIQNLINTYSDSSQGINAITNMYVVSDAPMGLFAIDVNGNSGYWIGDDSDRKLKEHIEDSDISALKIIDKIKHRKFKWKKSKKEQSIGYIAQEIEELNKDLIYKFPKNPKEQAITDEDYSYQINNVAMNALSTKAIQELHGVVKNQQKQINELKQELEKLRSERNGQNKFSK